MASLNSDDCLLVGRDGVDYKVHYESFVESLEKDLNIDASGGSVSWNDLTDKPAIPNPANNGRLRIKDSDGHVLGTFRANSDLDVDIDLPDGGSMSLEGVLMFKGTIFDKWSLPNPNDAEIGWFYLAQLGSQYWVLDPSRTWVEAGSAASVDMSDVMPRDLRTLPPLN